MQRNVIISSSGRKLGKTLLACSLIRLLREAGWSVAFVKLARGGHGDPGLYDGPGRPDSDTDRCSRAGASRVCLFRYARPEELPGILGPLAGSEDAVVWESGTVRRFVDPDLHVHIGVGGGDGAEDPAIPPAGFLVRGPLDPDGSDRIARMAAGMLGSSLPPPFRVGGKHWLALEDGRPLFGEGRIGLLKAVRDAGSILGASEAVGIPYKRAWVLLHEAEKALGADLIRSDRGGRGGGGTRLTALGEWLLDVWDRSERGFRELLDRLEAR